MRPLSDDFYELLGVHPFTTPTELRRAWRRLALLWHPDHAGPHAAPTFRKLAAAYAVLSDPASRDAYDRRRGRQEAAVEPRRAARPPSKAPSAGAPAVMLSRITGSLDSLMARGIARPSEPDLIDLYLDESEASEGGMAMISMRVDIACAECAARHPSAEGTRQAGQATCPRCRGSGKVRELFSAWLAIRPNALDGSRIVPSATLPGMLHTPTFRIRTCG